MCRPSGDQAGLSSFSLGVLVRSFSFPPALNTQMSPSFATAMCRLSRDHDGCTVLLVVDPALNPVDSNWSA